MNYKKLCAIFGENPDELEFGYDEEYYTCSKMKLRLVLAMQEVIKNGCDCFVSTVEQGAAMWGAEACAAMKASGTDVGLVSVPISETQAVRWHPERRERYYNVLEASDEVVEQTGELDAVGYIFEHISSMIVLGSPDNQRLSALISEAREKGIAVITV